MKIEIVTIGDELLLGFTIDTNAAYLARELAAFGVEVVRRSTCGDNAADIAAAVRDALDRTGGVITTGGLGPTADDITKASIAALFGRAMHLNEDIAEGLRAMWRARKRPGELPKANYVQAMIPDGARILANSRGTAPGIFLEDERRRWVAMLPGVPSEMRGMFDDVLSPMLFERVRAESPNAPVVASRTVRTTGIAESVLAERLGTLGQGFDGMSLAYLPGMDGVDLRLTIRGVSKSEADARLTRGAEQLRAAIGNVEYGEDSASLASVVLNACRARGARIAVAESCTGGMLGARITAVPGSSDVFWGGVIAYDNQVKIGLLDVPDALLAAHGAVSEPVVLAMAHGARERVGAEIGVGITGIAGPGGGTSDKPVGTVWIAVEIALDRRDPATMRPSETNEVEREARVFHFVGDRDEIRYRASQAALEMIRRGLRIG